MHKPLSMSITVLVLLLAGCQAVDDQETYTTEDPTADTSVGTSVEDGDGLRDPSSSTVGSSTGTGTGTVDPGQLTAGEWDDNANPDVYEQYVDDFLQAGETIPAYGIHDRIQVSVVNEEGHGLSCALVHLWNADGDIGIFPAGTDGRLMLFPSRDGFADVTDLSVTVSPAEEEAGGTPLTFHNPSGSEWVLELPGTVGATPHALDLAFVIDATGSMGDEMVYVQAEVAAIVEMIQDYQADLDIRFGLIVYRDEGDEYVTRPFDFTADLSAFQSDLADQMASGGGDYPEAVHTAVEVMNTLSWRQGNVARVAFFIADAPPHDIYVDDTFAGLDETRSLGVRLFPVAASGVADLAEYVMRTMAQATMAHYVFLTSDSGIGGEHAEPHIPCYHVELLYSLMARLVIGELVGGYVPPTEDQIIRTVGDPVDGVCM